MGKLLLALETLQEQQIQKTLKPDKPAVVPMSERERAEALAFLQRRDLIAQIGKDFHACGLVGEDTNCLIGYLATVSRKLDEPLALIIQRSRRRARARFRRHCCGSSRPKRWCGIRR